MVMNHLKRRTGRSSQPVQSKLQANQQTPSSSNMQQQSKSQTPPSRKDRSKSAVTTRRCCSASRLVLLGVLAVGCSVLSVHFAMRSSSAPKSAVIMNDATDAGASSAQSNTRPTLASTTTATTATTTTTSSRTPSRRKKMTTSRPTVTVLSEFPHDAKAFTQGLLVHREPNGQKVLIESTGLYGQSSVRKVDITTGQVLQIQRIADDLFGEGIALVDDRIVMLTWKSNRGLVFDVKDLKETDSFRFNTVTGEGWGIDCDGKELVVSDGSSYLQFWDPRSLRSERQVQVTINNQPVNYVNELELAKGFVYANVWYQQVIIKIDPQTGRVLSVFDCSDLVRQANAGQTSNDAVLNGIAYDEEEDVFYLTGKLWDRVFKVKLQD